ncbi:MAG: DUF4097 family beta strand repeat-containing protein [bacterium]|nr:DUF4097 family beta strand repeat-containing protein [bacterium]
MPDNKIEILKQVETGQISVDEALVLLEKEEKLGQTEEVKPDKVEVKAAIRGVLDEVGEFLKVASDSANVILTDVGTKLRNTDGLRNVLGGLFSNLYSFGAGKEYLFVHEIKIGASAPNLFMHGRNGRIEMKQWNMENAKLTVTVRLRSMQDDLDEQEMAKEAYSLHSVGSDIKVETSNTNSRFMGVSYELFLPEKKFLLVDVSTSNGSITVEGISGEKISVRTSNGRVKLQECNFAITEAKTSNGAIVALLQPKSDSTLSLRTSNGRIEVEVQEGDEIGYSIEAGTSNGRISSELKGLKVNTSRNTLSARSENCEGKKVMVNLNARTSNGSIRIVGN